MKKAKLERRLAEANQIIAAQLAELEVSGEEVFKANGRVVHAQAAMRNVLRALGPDRPNWEISTEAIAKARRLCRDYLDG